MNPVTILIFNTLARRKSINLPDVGSLRVIHRAAQLKSNKLIAPPINIVEYSSKDNVDALNIIDLIAQSSGKDAETAQRIYEKWLSESVDDAGAIIIESVGLIKSGFFKIDAELQDTLNPMGVKPTNVPRNGNKSIYLAMILSIVLGGGISAGIIIMLNQREANKFMIEESIPQPQVTTPEINEEEILSDTINIIEETASTMVTPTATPTPSVAAVPVGTNYYVIIGTYSTEDNADKYIASAKKLDGTLSYGKLTLRNGKIMVYTSVWDSEQKAQQNRTLASFPEAWVFKYTTK